MTSPWFLKILLLILLIGVGLRVAYVDHQSFNPDEQIAEAVVRNLSFPRQWDTNWAKTDVTEIFHYDQYNFSSYHYLLYFWKGLVSLPGVDSMGHPWVLRVLNGLFGTVFIVAVALAGRQFAGDLAGIFAAAAGAVLPLLVQDAHYVRCEAMLTAGVAVLLWLTGRSRSKTHWTLFFCGLIAGWMVACKVTMVLALPLLLPALLFASGFKPGKWKSVLVSGGVAGIGFGIGVIAGMPWAVIQPDVYFSGLSKLAEHYRLPFPPYTSPDMVPSFRVTVAYFTGTLGWGFWAVTGFGLVCASRSAGWWRTTLIALPLVGSFVVFGSHAFFSERSYSPFLPIAVLFFGAGGQWLLAAILRCYPFRPGYRGALVSSLLGILLALPVVYSWQIVFRGFSGDDQNEQVTFFARTKGELVGQVFVIVGPLFGAEDCRKIESVIGKEEPLLLIVCDDCDLITPTCLAVLKDKYDARIIGVRDSLFPSIPACTLQTFISPRLWVLHIPAK